MDLFLAFASATGATSPKALKIRQKQNACLEDLDTALDTADHLISKTISERFERGPWLVRTDCTGDKPIIALTLRGTEEEYPGWVEDRAERAMRKVGSLVFCGDQPFTWLIEVAQ